MRVPITILDNSKWEKFLLWETSRPIGTLFIGHYSLELEVGTHHVLENLTQLTTGKMDFPFMAKYGTSKKIVIVKHSILHVGKARTENGYITFTINGHSRIPLLVSSTKDGTIT